MTQKSLGHPQDSSAGSRNDLKGLNQEALLVEELMNSFSSLRIQNSQRNMENFIPNGAKAQGEIKMSQVRLR